MAPDFLTQLRLAMECNGRLSQTPSRLSASLSYMHCVCTAYMHCGLHATTTATAAAAAAAAVAVVAVVAIKGEGLSKTQILIIGMRGEHESAQAALGRAHRRCRRCRETLRILM